MIVIVYFLADYFRGEAGIYGVKTLHIVIGFAILVTLFMLKSLIADSQFRVEIRDNQISFIDGDDIQTYDIQKCSFSFYSAYSNGMTDDLTLYIIDEKGDRHSIDLTALGSFEFERFKAELDELLDLEPNTIVTQDDEQ